MLRPVTVSMMFVLSCRAYVRMYWHATLATRWKKTDRRAFRLCIPESDRERLLHVSKWPDSVTVSEWYRIPPSVAAERRRCAADSATWRCNSVRLQLVSVLRRPVSWLDIVLQPPLKHRNHLLTLSQKAWTWILIWTRVQSPTPTPVSRP